MAHTHTLLWSASFQLPTYLLTYLKVEFEVNLVILFSDGHLLTENFPLKLIRTR